MNCFLWEVISIYFCAYLCEDNQRCTLPRCLRFLVGWLQTFVLCHIKDFSNTRTQKRSLHTRKSPFYQMSCCGIILPVPTSLTGSWHRAYCRGNKDLSFVRSTSVLDWEIMNVGLKLLFWSQLQSFISLCFFKFLHIS